MENGGILLEDWQKPVSESQIQILKTSRNTINTITFEDFLSGRNPNYQAVGGKISREQIEKLERIVEEGEYSHVNFETVERFLKREKPFKEDYFSLKRFAKKNEKRFCIWESVFYELKNLAEYPVKVKSFRTLCLHSEIKKDISKKFLMKALGTEKTVFNEVPEIYEIISFLRFGDNKIHRDGKWNFIPIVNGDKEIDFLKVWVYRGIINLEMPYMEPDYIFEKTERIFLLNQFLN